MKIVVIIKYKYVSQYYSTISPISITVIGIVNIILTHWGLVMPFGDIYLGQHWLR